MGPILGWMPGVFHGRVNLLLLPGWHSGWRWGRVKLGHSLRWYLQSPPSLPHTSVLLYPSSQLLPVPARASTEG